MKTFDEIYEEIASDDNEELKVLWKELKKEKAKSKKISLTICAIVDFLILMLFGENIINEIRGIGLLFLLVISIFSLVINIKIFRVVSIIMVSGAKQMQYEDKYKKMIIKKMISNFYEELSNKRISTTILVCNGLFTKVIMDKSINGEVKILRNGSANFDKKHLRIDSSEFEKYFDVFASDKILGMRLLTSDVIEELISFVNNTNMMYEVVIKDDILYLRFRSMFETSNFNKSYLDKETLRKYFYMLNLTYNLSNKIIKTVEEFEV